jgi:RNA polymerase sigma-70 factor (ECF subfamily)
MMSQNEFTKAFCQFQRPLLAFASHLTNNEEEARDLLQETAYKAFKYRSMYRPHTNLRAWLMTIMRNTFINDYRQKKRRQVLNDYTPNQYLLNAGNQMVDNGGESSVTMKEIRGVVEELEDWLKVPFLLHYKGFKYEEIATELEIPLGTVKSRIFFARQKLQERLHQIYNAPGLPELLN